MAITLDNFVRSVLSQDATAADNQLVLALAAAPLRDPPAASVAAPGVLILQDAPTAPTKIEVIRYTGRTIAGGNVTLTGVTRGLEGTTAQAWAAGTPTFQGWTAGVLSEIMNGTAAAALRLANPRMVSLSGVINATGVPFDGTADLTLATTIADGALTIAKTSGLQTSLDGKLSLTGGTLTGALNGTIASFIGAVTAATNFNSSTTTAALSASASGGQVLLRPNGPGSSTGQLVLDSGGNASIPGTFTAGASVSANTNFLSSTANVVLAPNGAGTVYLRPNGGGSVSGQATINSSGLLEASSILSDNNVTANTNFLSSNSFWLAAPNGSGTLFFRPNGVGSTTNQSTLGPNGVWTAVDFQATSDLSAKSGIKPLRRGVAALKQMPPIEYTIGGKRQIGYGAQHAQQVIPEAVSRDPATGLLQLSYGQVSALLGDAILEVERRLSMLEAR